MNPYIEILRPGNALMSAISIILVALIDKTISIPVVLAMLAVFFETAAGNVINDYFDYKIDLINKPDRPIPSGRISLKNGRNYGYFLFFMGTVCGFFISYLTNNWIPFAIVLFADVVLYLYAYKLKSTPLLGNLTVGFMTGFGFVFGGFSINNPTIIMTSIFLGFFALVMTTAREIIKDIEDILTSPKYRHRPEDKISSSQEIIMGFETTPKVISLIKDIKPETFLVGFKLVKHNQDNNMIRQAEKLRKTNNCDAVFTNEASQLSVKEHAGVLLYKGEPVAYPVGKKEIAEAIVNLAFNKIN